MTADQYVVLTVLSEVPEATQQTLAARCYSDTATMGAMITLLESKGWVSRVPHPWDRRAWSVRITPPGRALARRMRRASAALRVELAGLFDPEELAVLLRCLERLAGAMRPARRRASGQKRTPSDPPRRAAGTRTLSLTTAKPHQPKRRNRLA